MFALKIDMFMIDVYLYVCMYAYVYLCLFVS